MTIILVLENMFSRCPRFVLVLSACFVQRFVQGFSSGLYSLAFTQEYVFRSSTLKLSNALGSDLTDP